MPCRQRPYRPVPATPRLQGPENVERASWAPAERTRQPEASSLRFHPHWRVHCIPLRFPALPASSISGRFPAGHSPAVLFHTSDTFWFQSFATPLSSSRYSLLTEIKMNVTSVLLSRFITPRWQTDCESRRRPRLDPQPSEQSPREAFLSNVSACEKPTFWQPLRSCSDFPRPEHK